MNNFKKGIILISSVFLLMAQSKSLETLNKEREERKKSYNEKMKRLNRETEQIQTEIKQIVDTEKGETENQRQLRLIMEEQRRQYDEVDKRMKMHRNDYEDKIDRINKRSTEPITNYIIIKIEPISSNNSDLGNSVIDDLIVRGWQPYGPPYVDNENNHHQPFVKYRKKYDY